jgi:phosphonate transport system ATP-binding protein
MAAGRVVFDAAPEMLTDDVARELYGIEADDVIGGRSETQEGEKKQGMPALGQAAAA